jgi:hypothetical protein
LYQSIGTAFKMESAILIISWQSTLLLIAGW